ncbi:hypothetical protein KUK_1056 [Taylorella equigenitalis 14/56]|nr:hypothetical protein KUI_0045 [Taylorella equigenitalis ATCC 35865]ASY29846.1 hypothetical protein B9Z30_00225 [Taylorella equigenitalis]CCG18353.1 hypothetical protein KUK_1056 [Taylorella equigenitalis 14/56]ASY37150.1 hypothetical protein CA605_00225 [Taylorella equigenitalis]ASY38594.1 hypothetical protein CA604_00225 [Taylorella equigenitalis]
MRVNRHDPVQHVLNFIFFYLLLCVVVTAVFALTLLFKNDFNIQLNNLIRLLLYTLGYIVPVMSVPAFLVAVGSYFLLNKGTTKKNLMLWSAGGAVIIAIYDYFSKSFPELWWLSGLIMGLFFYFTLIRLSVDQTLPQDK